MVCADAITAEAWDVLKKRTFLAIRELPGFAPEHGAGLRRVIDMLFADFQATATREYR